jgi:hypothetical protein
MSTPKERKEERTARVTAARAARAREKAQEEMRETLGDELTAALLRYLAGKPERTMSIERAISLSGYSDELKRLIVRCIEVNPAMEESFLLIAELAYRDAEDAVHEDWFMEEYH